MVENKLYIFKAFKKALKSIISLSHCDKHFLNVHFELCLLSELKEMQIQQNKLFKCKTF